MSGDPFRDTFEDMFGRTPPKPSPAIAALVKRINRLERRQAKLVANNAKIIAEVKKLRKELEDK